MLDQPPSRDVRRGEGGGPTRATTSWTTAALVGATALADQMLDPQTAIVLGLAELVVVAWVPLRLTLEPAQPTRSELGAALAIVLTSAAAATSSNDGTATLHALTATLGGVPALVAALSSPRTANRNRHERDR